MLRSSDIPARETELDRSVDDAAQLIVEAAHDWRRPFYTRRGIDWSRLARLERKSAA